MKVAHTSDKNLFDRYYLNQAGGGGVVFKGARMQRGHGLGGLFSGILKSAIPLLKSGLKAAVPMFKRGAMTLGKQMLDTGMNVAGDMLAGQSLKTAAKNRVSQAKNQLKRKALQKIAAGPPGKRAKTRQKRRRDIFDV